ENQQNCLMFDAVSAHTDCLIQIVKERRNSVLLREWNSTQPPSRVKPYFKRLFEVNDEVVCVAACPVDVAHYREIDRVGKALNAIKLQKSALFLVIHNQPQLLYKLIHRNAVKRHYWHHECPTFSQWKCHSLHADPPAHRPI
ncbi:hypothetical protein, partial [Aeromonas salmonicida]|uniref:hypothetical protein n=1 Tax=Aeromonas salmonicida TaxID=645 RepID=UPI0019550E65